MLKNFIVGFSAVLLIVSIGMATNVQARLSQAFSSQVKVAANDTQRFKTIDCETGAGFVQRAGFNHVFATDCSGVQYTYNGFRKSVEYTIVFNADSGGMSTISR